MRFEIPDSETEFPSDIFQSITTRFARAGWIEGVVIETVNAVVVTYTARGRERIRRLEEVIDRFKKRDEARKKRPLSIIIGISHKIDLFVLKVRVRIDGQRFGLGSLDEREAEKLIAFVWTRGCKITWV